VGRRKHYLVVDGYNMINYWERLKNILTYSLEDARQALIRMIQSYAKVKNYDAIVVFDAYNNDEMVKVEELSGIKVVYSGKNQTADTYIEKFLYDLSPVHEVTVATSDFMLQRMVVSAGGNRMSARELEKEIEFSISSNMKKIKMESEADKNHLFKSIDRDTIEKLKKITTDPDHE
jgi:predicted RNA-binding protein with PIN domain